MSPLKYQCLSCGNQWGNPLANDDNISHGFCQQCVQDRQKEKIRKRQRESGFSDCYARNYSDCTEFICEFRSTCMDSIIKEWEKGLIKDGKRKEIERYPQL
jgi:hypothetical protein